MRCILKMGDLETAVPEPSRLGVGQRIHHQRIGLLDL